VGVHKTAAAAAVLLKLSRRLNNKDRGSAAHSIDSIA
jgi:hypothetical protein